MPLSYYKSCNARRKGFGGRRRRLRFLVVTTRISSFNTFRGFHFSATDIFLAAAISSSPGVFSLVQGHSKCSFPEEDVFFFFAGPPIAPCQQQIDGYISLYSKVLYCQRFVGAKRKRKKRRGSRRRKNLVVCMSPDNSVKRIGGGGG